MKNRTLDSAWVAKAMREPDLRVQTMASTIIVVAATTSIIVISMLWRFFHD